MTIPRNTNCRPDVTLETCWALIFHFRSGEKSSSLVVWRKRSPNAIRFEPLEDGKRISELRAGDRVRIGDRDDVIEGVEIFL